MDFYSRPCGRGDGTFYYAVESNPKFLLTPLREGRRPASLHVGQAQGFLLTPLREGRQLRGGRRVTNVTQFLLTPLREGRHYLP